MRAIVRDFDDDKLAAHMALLRRTAEEVVAGAPGARLEVEVTRSTNMRRFVEQFPQATTAERRSSRRASSRSGRRSAAAPTAHG